MSYTPPSGSNVTLDLPSGISIPKAGSVTLEFDPSYTANIRGVGGIPSPIFKQTGFIVRNQRKNLYLAGIPPPAVSITTNIEIASIKMYPDGIAPFDMPTSALQYPQLVLNSGGIDAPANALPISRIRVKGGYSPPPASSVILEFGTVLYSSPPASSVILDFGAVGYSNILGTSLGNQSAFGVSSFTKQAGLFGITLGDQSAFGAATMQNSGKSIYAQGIAPVALPVNHNFEKIVKLVNPVGIPYPSFPNTIVFDNRLKRVSPIGITPPGFPTTLTITNFKQVVNPTGIAPPVFTANSSISYGSTDWDTFNYSLMLF